MNSPFQGAEIPGMASMNDPLGFVKKLWGDMQLPGMVTPTVSVDELDKKIKDLKTVESWLNVNMNMLRGTIQALEVQRATIATLKSMGESFAQQMNTASTSTGFTAAPTPDATKSNAAWPMPAAAEAPAPAKAAAKVTEPSKAEPAAPTAKASKVETNSETGAPFANPAAWWGLLQDQFKQAVSTAMENDPTVAASKSKPAAATTATPAKAPAKAPPKTRAKATVKTAVKKNGVAAKPVSKRAPSK